METAIPSASVGDGEGRTTIRPSRVALWTFALLLLGSLGLLQLFFGGVFLFLYSVFTDVDLTELASDIGFLSSEPALVLGLFAYFFTALIVIGVAFVWPTSWRAITESPQGPTAAEWLGWRPSTRLPMWVVPLLTLAYIAVVGITVTGIFGDATVDVQLLLFSTPLLQVVAVPVAGILAPIAEELVFRGALYNAMLPDKHQTQPEWVRHIGPFLVTSSSFVAIHAFAGFEEPGSFLLIIALSLYLSGLRAWTGSVKPAIIAHMTSNIASIIGLILAIVFVGG